MKDFIRKNYFLFIGILFVVGFFSYLGLISIISVTSGAEFTIDNLKKYILTAFGVALTPLFYPLYKYFDNRRKASKF